MALKNSSLGIEKIQNSRQILAKANSRGSSISCRPGNGGFLEVFEKIFLSLLLSLSPLSFSHLSPPLSPSLSPLSLLLDLSSSLSSLSSPLSFSLSPLFLSLSSLEILGKILVGESRPVILLHVLDNRGDLSKKRSENKLALNLTLGLTLSRH